MEIVHYLLTRPVLVVESELCEHARKELGHKFDVRSFHDEVLDGSALPLDMLELRINSSIAARKQPEEKLQP